MKRNKNKNIVSNQKNHQIKFEKSSSTIIDKYNILDYLKYLSFDVAFGAVAVAIAFSKILKIDIHDCIPMFVVLFFAVLAIYNFDHFRDSKVSNSENIDNQNNQRRLFFHQNSKLLLYLIVISFCVIAYQSLFYLDLYVISSGIFLSFSQIMYFYYLKKSKNAIFKELWGSIGYTLGCALPLLFYAMESLNIHNSYEFMMHTFPIYIILAFKILLSTINNMLAYDIIDKKIDELNNQSSLLNNKQVTFFAKQIELVRVTILVVSIVLACIIAFYSSNRILSYASIIHASIQFYLPNFKLGSDNKRIVGELSYLIFLIVLF